MVKNNADEKSTTKIKKKTYGSIIAIAVLFIMLAVTTYALIASLVSVDNNIFETAKVEIELNGGKVIFDGSDMNLEPGRSITKEFTVENKSSVDIHYRLYLENVTGALQEVLFFEIYDGDVLLFSGDAKSLDKNNPAVSVTPLKVGETKGLQAVVKMKENAGNDYMTAGINFDVTADAVQARNNSGRIFE